MGPTIHDTPKHKKPITEKLTKADPRVLMKHAQKIMEVKKAAETQKMKLLRAPKPNGVRDVLKS